MNVIYRELATDADFNQCVELQKSIFGLTDVQTVSPLILKLIARNDPSVGLSVGVFRSDADKTELIGFLIGYATFVEKAIYGLMLGIKAEFQKGIYAFKLMLSYREIALSRNIEFIYGAFEPLDANIARFNIATLGYISYKYDLDKNISGDFDGSLNFPNDKILVRWDMNSKRAFDKINRINTIPADYLIKNTPIATIDSMPDSPKVLVQIPENFEHLRMSDVQVAVKWRKTTRNVLSEYMNKRNYIINDCISLKSDNERISYYLLEKQ